MRQALHAHDPDILVLTETKLYDSNNKHWLNKLLKYYKCWSSPHGSAGTRMGTRTGIAGLSQAKLKYADQEGRLVAVNLRSQHQDLIIIGTYWPSGSSTEAIASRHTMQGKVRDLITENHSCTPLLLGDMNATYYDDDRSSLNVYASDKTYIAFLQGINLQSLPEHDPGHKRVNELRSWTYL